MSDKSLRGVLRGQTVTLSEPQTEFPDGTEVVITPIDPRRGDPEALFAALDELPPMSQEDADLILRVIKEEFGQIDPKSWE